MRALALAALALFALPAEAQLAEGGTRVLGMGRAGAALEGVWGHTNPSGRAGLEDGRAAVQASQAFGLSELQLGAAAVAVPTPAGVVALDARTYGFSERRETRVLLGLARPVRLSTTRRLSVGVRVGLESASTEGFGSETVALLDAGVQGAVVNGLRVGLAARNLLGLGRSDSTDLRHSASTVPGLTVGLAYAPSDNALLLVDVDQDLDQYSEFGLSVRAGVEVRPVEVLALRAGVSTEPARFTAGAGFVAGSLRADLALERHETLGLTPAFGVEVSF